MQSNDRTYSLTDRIIMALQYAIEDIHQKPEVQRVNPMEKYQNDRDEHTEEEKTHVAGLMRINHAGELAAQGLYHGQAASGKTSDLKNFMEQAAKEEVDHLNWCHERLRTLESYPSYFSKFWYLGSFTLGLIAGALGDRWNLGFVAETERQVVAHIDEHLAELPQHDKKTRVILETMRADELQHAHQAEVGGAAPLPFPLPWVMGKIASFMKKTAYYF